MCATHRSDTTDTGGIRAANRRALELLHRAGGPITVEGAAGVLNLDVASTRRLLAYLARRGWLARVRRGLYTPVPLDANVSGQWHEDPWVAASITFAPCYIGGWSALEHWGLTEQLFRTVMVFTARRVRHRADDFQGTPIRLKVVGADRLFGTRAIWRERARIELSDPSRTVVDVLNDPSVGGGMGHITAAVVEYFAGEHRDDRLLVNYGDRLGNRAIFKRLGYIVEQLHIDAPDLLEACKERRSTGIVAFDPTVDAKGRIVRRWGMRVNVDITDIEGWT